MSTPSYHPSEDLLWDYHRGALAANMALAVRAHADTCEHCRDDLRLFSEIGGVLLADIEGAPLSDSALDLALARIERPDTDEPPAVVRTPAFLEGFDLPESLRSAAVKGRYHAGPGVWLAPVEVADMPKGAKCYFMHVKAGMVMPEHTHKGREITLMLRGSYSDHKGTYRAGDFVVCDDEDQRHAPAMGAEEDCLCFVAQEAAIVPQSVVAWLLQPFARI